MSRPILYHCRGSRSLRCLWAAREAGFDCDIVFLPFPPRFLKPEYKEVNPLGTVPAWAENGQLLTESAAICQRIAMGTPLEIRPEEPDHAPYLNWLHRSDATLTFPLTIMLRYTRLEPEERRLGQAVDDYRAFFNGRARSVEAALADGRDWLVGGRFTIADICIGYAFHLAEGLGAIEEQMPLTQAWRTRIESRPAFVEARDLKEKS